MNTKGIGLGLYIAQKITNQFKGQITYKERKKEGSIFTFRFMLQS